MKTKHLYQMWIDLDRFLCYLLSFLGGEVTDVPKQPGLHSEPNRSKGDPKRPGGDIGHEKNPGWICISGSTVFKDRDCGDFISGLYKVCPVMKRYWTLRQTSCLFRMVPFFSPAFVLFCSTFPKPDLLRSVVSIRMVFSFCAGVLSYPEILVTIWCSTCR